MHSRFLLGCRTLSVCLLWAAGGMSVWAQDAGTRADNSANNKQAGVTADNASNHKSDVKLAADIRRAIEKDKQVSTYAHNVKVIVKGGVVTLKGPVRSQEEHDALLSLAKQNAGSSSVQDEMNVAPPKS